MSRECYVCGKKKVVGGRITHRGLPKKAGGIGLQLVKNTKRTFKPNLQKKRIWVPELNRWVTVRCSVKALKTMDRDGPYKVLLKAGLIKPRKPKTKRQAARA